MTTVGRGHGGSASGEGRAVPIMGSALPATAGPLGDTAGAPRPGGRSSHGKQHIWGRFGARQHSVRTAEEPRRAGGSPPHTGTDTDGRTAPLRSCSTRSDPDPGVNPGAGADTSCPHSAGRGAPGTISPFPSFVSHRGKQRAPA